MLKKKITKLSLNKKTLRNLEDQKLADVNGGATFVECTNATRACSECTGSCSACTAQCSICCP